jgi:hypothetical protein
VGSLVIPHNGTGGSTTVSLTGAGAGSSFTLAPNPIGFGTLDINKNKTQTVTVKNVGTVAAPVSSATITGTNAANFAVTGTGCIGTTVQPNKTCNLTVTFRPTAVQAYSASLVVAGNATTVPATVQDAMTGSGK